MNENKMENQQHRERKHRLKMHVRHREMIQHEKRFQAFLEKEIKKSRGK